MLSAGSSGYLLKDETPARIIESVREVFLGETGVMNPVIKAKTRKK